MSALETTVRVNSERQTLILAGETVPQRFAYAASPLHPLTLVATPVDDPLLLVQGGFAELSPQTAFAQNRVASLAERGSASHAATAYARTQQLPVGSARTALIDTYA